MDRYQGHKLPVLVYRHPFQIGIGVALAVIGMRTLWLPESRPASIDTLPTWLSFGYAAALLVGGAAMVVGLVIACRTTWGLFLEQIGLWLGAFAFGSYGLGLFAVGGYNPRTTMTVVTLAALAAALIVRSRAAMLDSRYTLLGIRQEKARRHNGGQ